MSLATDGFTYLGTLKVPSVTGSASDVPVLVKTDDFTATMLANLESNGDDLRFSSDIDGDNQLPIDIVDGLDVVWTSIPTAATDQLIYVWGNKPLESQPAADAAFGSEAVWVDYKMSLQLDEAANNTSGGYADSTGNGHDGTGTSMSASSVPNLSGEESAVFNGDPDEIVIDVAGLADELTIEFWVKPDDLTKDQRAFSIYEAPAVNPAQRIFATWMDKDGANAGWAALRAAGTSTTVGIDSDNAISGEWQRVAIHVNSTEMSVYVDGVLGDSTTITSPISFGNAETITIGRLWKNSGSGSYFNGALSCVTVAEADLRSQLGIKQSNQSATGAWWIATDVPSGGFSPIWATHINQLIQ